MVDARWVHQLKAECENRLEGCVSEFVANEVHERILRPVDAQLTAFKDFIAAAIARDPTKVLSHLINVEFLSQRQAAQDSINGIRQLLRRNARERELQDALVHSGLLSMHSKVFKEVALRKSSKYRGMRLDVVVPNNGQGVCDLFELKRGAHLLISRKRRKLDRPSRCLENSIMQAALYKRRIGEDLDTQEHLEKTCKARTKEFTVRLVAGRKLEKASDYMLIYRALDHTTESATGLPDSIRLVSLSPRDMTSEIRPKSRML